MLQTSYDLLPPNATAEERALALAAQFGENLLPENIKALWNPDNIPAAFIPFLAWALHIDYWDDALPEETKRAILHQAFEWHRYKGTPWAVKRALLDLGFADATILEWPETGDKPYTFSIRIRPFDGELFSKAKRVAFEYKNARSHLTEIIGNMSVKEDIAAEDEAFIRRDKLLSDHYPWPGNFYSDLETPLKYLGAKDKMAAEYGIYETLERLTTVLKVCIIDYMFAQYKYGDSASPEHYYNSSITYGADIETDSVVIQAAGGSDMVQEILITEDNFGVAIQWIL